MAVQRCESTIEGRDGGGAGAPLPFDPKEVFGRARAPVRVTVNGHESFQTTVAIYGGVGWIGFRKTQLASMGLTAGDAVTMVIELDDGPRAVVVPAELATALASDKAAQAAYDRLSFSHRREYAHWVGDAKQSATRESRATKAVAMLRDGTRTPS